MNESDNINTLIETPEYLDKLKEYYSLKKKYDTNRKEKNACEALDRNVDFSYIQYSNIYFV